MRIIGIDPGKNGYIAVLQDGKYEFAFIMPTLPVSKKTTKRDFDVKDMTSSLVAIQSYNPSIDLVVIEKQQARPAPEGRGSIFSTGRGFGLLEGIVAALGYPYIIVHPKTWQKVMHAGVQGDNTKTRSILAAGRLFPDVDMRKTERCKKAHDGKAEALLLAMYGHKYLNGGM